MAKEKKTGLGGGLDALFQTAERNQLDGGEMPENAVLELNINDIEPGDGQPRKAFDKEKIAQLADSIREHGVIQPIIVSKTGRVYKIIAGERRWRAARLAGLKKIPAIEKSVTNQQILEMALIENIQREDLNPIEEAEAYNRLISEYQMTQEKLAQVVSKSRSAIANTLRLLGLCEKVRGHVISGELSEGHARCLLAVRDEKQQEEAADTVIRKKLSVRETERLVKNLSEKKERKEDKTESFSDEHALAVNEIQNQLKSALGTKVILQDRDGKGKIVIDYFSAEERERLIAYLTKK